VHALFNATWTGTSEDLRLLTRLRRVGQVGVHGVRLDEASLAVLGRLRGLEQLQLYGTGASDAALAAIAAKLPDTKIDVRKGGKLGVAGQSVIGPCLITHVQEGSAAADAGVQIGDIVLHIDGQPVANFESLTDLVGRRGPGDTIELEIERGGANPGAEPQRFKRTVKLGGWE
jgi:membrane-associated protease RseP (regulator of RpoE activity)